MSDEIAPGARHETVEAGSAAQVSWRERVIAYIREQAQPSDKFGHQPRLYRLCREIVGGEHADPNPQGGQRLHQAEPFALETLDREPPDREPPDREPFDREPFDREPFDRGQVDDDVLFAAAWMHDLGVFLGHRPADPLELAAWNHVPYTIERTVRLLTEWGFPLQKLPAVSEAIRTHQAKDEPVAADAVVLRDADILEQLGAVGALRALVKVGRDTRFPSYSEVMPTLSRALEVLPSKLQLARSKALAEPKIIALRQFLSAVENEAGEMLF